MLTRRRLQRQPSATSKTPSGRAVLSGCAAPFGCAAPTAGRRHPAAQRQPPAQCHPRSTRSTRTTGRLTINTETTTTADAGASAASAPPPTSTDGDRDTRVGLLARADRDALVQAADACLGELEASTLSGPQLGTVLLQVREPIERRRFYLGDVLVTEVRLRLGEHVGWAMRLGDDPEATVAAAVCDAAFYAGGDHRARVLELCTRTRGELSAQRSAEMADISATAVAFEELGG
ncbi:phosphonate C-P lyase system protein PhnG [Streptomyces sp. NPDC004752]